MSVHPKHPVAVIWSLALSMVVLFPQAARATDIDEASREKLDRWAERQRQTESLTASFVQERQLRTIRRPLVSNGRMWWRRDSGFRWEVGDPPKVILIQDAGGHVAELKPSRRQAELRSREEAEKQMHGLGFGFSTFFDADPSGWENKLELLSCRPLESDPEQVVAEFGFREAKLATAVRRMVIIADTGSGDLREFRLLFRDMSTILLRFHPMRKDTAIDPALFEIDLEGYTVSRP